MTLNEMIYHRKSCRSFTGKPVDAEMIEKILTFEMKPLYVASSRVISVLFPGICRKI